MKFSLFAHMERLSATQNHQDLYQDFLSLCTLADEGGMRAIWTGEHHGMEFTIAPNPFITITDLARHTKNVKLGTGTIIAPFWHPIRLAGEAAMTDLVTDGRLELGIARGAYSYEYERMMPGMDAWEAGQRMRETTPLLRQLWAGDCAHEGEFFNFPETTSAPKPLQSGGPPIWIAARDPNSHEFAVHNVFNVQVTPLCLRGREQFIEVSWDTAEDLVVAALQETIEQHGNQAIFAGSYGWASAGRFHHAQSQLKRFLNCAGGFVRSEGNYSYNAALVLMPHIVGNYRQHLKQATRWATVKDHTQLVVMFGGLPLRSAQVGGGGMGRHRLKHELIACREAGVEFINLSPLRTDAIDELNASWIAPRPGSDTAVMLAIAHTLLTEDLHDTEFCSAIQAVLTKLRTICWDATTVSRRTPHGPANSPVLKPMYCAHWPDEWRRREP